MPTDALATSNSKIDEFYDSLNTLPKLIGDLAMDIAEAQLRLDENYIENLAAFSAIVKDVLADEPTAEQYLALFRAIAPSRYQFTETVVEVRADLQTASSSELGVGASVGIKTGVFAAAVNVSYLKRSASDYQAAAVIRTVLNAVPADPGLLDKLLARGGDPPTIPSTREPRYRALAEALAGKLPKPPVLSPPAGD
jgi:hypothetical protein